MCGVTWGGGFPCGETHVVDASGILHHRGMRSSLLTPASAPDRRRATELPGASPVREAMLAPPPWDQIDRALASRSMHLRFEPELEARYEADTCKARQKVFTRGSNWIAPAVAILMYCDHFLVADVWGMAVMLRLLAMAPYTLLAHLFRHMMGTTRVLEAVAVIGVLTMGLAHLVIVSQSSSPWALVHLASISMVILFTAAFLRLRFRPGLVSISVLCLGAAMTWAWMPADRRALEIGLPVMLMIFSSAAFSLYALYHLDKESRRNYLIALKQALIRQDLQRTMSEVESMARVDALTQLPNRRHFGKQLERLWSRLQIDGAPVAVLVIDVDQFGQHNILHGARQSDACLHEVAQSIQRCLRRPNDIVARHEDDEFVAGLSHSGHEPASIVAERILAAVRALTVVPGSDQRVRVRVSIGVACLASVSEFDSSEALFAMARHALVSAKRQGGDQVVVSWSERPVV